MREIQQQPRYEKAIRAMCNYGWLIILGKDSRGNYKRVRKLLEAS